MITRIKIMRKAVILLFILIVPGCGGNGFVDTLPTQPTIATQKPTVISAKGATLSGVVNPMGNNVEAWFEWGTSTAYGSNTPPVSVGAGFNVVFVNTNITGLMTNLAFHYRLVVSNVVFFLCLFFADQVRQHTDLRRRLQCRL